MIFVIGHHTARVIFGANRIRTLVFYFFFPFYSADLGMLRFFLRFVVSYVFLTIHSIFLVA